mmetsp:Transcript_3354/g.9300  ORF Transcript_3354/g.9300 Transcript_3354/m.9300 type:complete len:608 (+) Transcript_3354:296-2119(+)
MSPPVPQPSSPLFASLTSIFGGIGLSRRPTPAFENLPDHSGSRNVLGDIWQGREAARAFEEGSLRSYFGPDEEDSENHSHSDSDRERDQMEDNSIAGGSVSSGDRSHLGSDSDDEDDSGGWDARGLEVVFRNESPSPLVLCWVSDSGEPHHFYRLDPVSTAKRPSSFSRRRFRLVDTDHLEHTHPGHAFCLGYAGDEKDVEHVQRSRSLIRQTATGTRRKTNHEGAKRNDRIRRSRKDGTSSIVVAGYRPAFRSSSSGSTSSSSSPSVLSRRVQLVTISHESADQQFLRRRTSQTKRACFGALPWCLGGKRRTPLHENESQYGDDSDDDDDNNNDFPRLDPNGWRAMVRWVETRSKPHDTTSKVYEKVTFGGWPCCLEPNWSGGDAVSAKKLERDIRAAAELLPSHARDYLQKHCTIWINRSLSWGPADCPEKGRGSCYHPSRGWLLKNGLSGDKHKCVEVNDAPRYKKDCDLWGIGGIMLHELCHAYHHGMLRDGYDNQDIRECYERAMEEGLYDRVEYHRSCAPGGRRTKASARAYASSNPMEYFAELSVAFLGGLDETIEYNKWYPFNRKQLEHHDPRAHALLSRLWKVDVGATTTTVRSKKTP